MEHCGPRTAPNYPFHNYVGGQNESTGARIKYFFEFRFSYEHRFVGFCTGYRTKTGVYGLYRLSYKNRFLGFSLTCLRLHKRVSFVRTPVGCGRRRDRWPPGCGTSGCRKNAPSTDYKSCSGPKNTVIKIKMS